MTEEIPKEDKEDYGFPNDYEEDTLEHYSRPTRVINMSEKDRDISDFLED